VLTSEPPLFVDRGINFSNDECRLI